MKIHVELINIRFDAVIGVAVDAAMRYAMVSADDGIAAMARRTTARYRPISST